MDDAKYEELRKLREQTRAKHGDAQPSYAGEQMQFFVTTSVTASDFQKHVSTCDDCLTAIAEAVMRDVIAGIKMTGQVHSHNTYDPMLMDLVHKREGKPGRKVERARISARRKQGDANS